MVLTAQEHAAIVKIMRHVISMMENVIITVVPNLDINHLVVEVSKLINNFILLKSMFIVQSVILISVNQVFFLIQIK